MLYTLIRAIILSINIQVVSTCTYMTTSGMHRRPFEGRHLVFYELTKINFFIQDYYWWYYNLVTKVMQYSHMLDFIFDTSNVIMHPSLPGMLIAIDS